MSEDHIENLAKFFWRKKWEHCPCACLSLQDQASSQLYMASTWALPPNTLSSFSLSNLFFPSVSFLTGVTYSHCHHHCYYWPAVHLSRATFREQFPSCAHIFEGFWSGQTPARLNLAHAGPLSLPVVSSEPFKHREIWAVSFEEAPGQNDWKFSKDKRPHCKLLGVSGKFLLSIFYGIFPWLTVLAVDQCSGKVWELLQVYCDLFLI